MLNGRVAVAYIVPRTPKDGVANVVVEVRLIDPLMGKIKSASIYYVREDAVQDHPKPDQNGLWPRLPDAQKVGLQLQARTARGELKVPCGDTTGVVYAYQIAHESGDGKLVNTEPGTFTVGLDAEVTGCYASDLLSDVMKNCLTGDLWITLQVHQNIVAVASMRELAGIVIIGGRVPLDDTVAKAKQENVTILTTDLPGFEVCGRLYEAGLRGTR